MREGIVITRALRTDGKQLVINAACGEGGYIDVEATDENEKVFEGCARADCNTYTRDSINAAVTWKHYEEIPHTGRLRLRFFLRNASLYSIQLVSPPVA